MSIKIKWKVGDAPTGRYRSFSDRAWPTGYIGDHPVVQLYCREGKEPVSYTPALAKDSTCGMFSDARIIVMIADYTNDNLGDKRDQSKYAFTWRKLKTTFTNINDAKAAAAKALEAHPDFLPKEPV